MNVPAGVAVVGAVMLIPVSPALIFGLGTHSRVRRRRRRDRGHRPITRSAALALICYHLVTARRAGARLTPPALHWPLSRDILRVGLSPA